MKTETSIRLLGQKELPNSIKSLLEADDNSPNDVELTQLRFDLLMIPDTQWDKIKKLKGKLYRQFDTIISETAGLRDLHSSESIEKYTTAELVNGKDPYSMIGKFYMHGHGIQRLYQALINMASQPELGTNSLIGSLN